MAVPLALTAAAQVCSDFRGTVLSCEELERARKFNRDIPRLAMLKSSHRSIRREMNKAGLLHALPARWEVGHACPNEPGSARDRGIEDRGQNLFAQTHNDNHPARGLGGCQVSCQEAAFYHAHHVPCNDACARGENCCSRFAACARQLVQKDEI